MTENQGTADSGAEGRLAQAEGEAREGGSAIDALASDLEAVLRRQLDELEELVCERPLAAIGLAAGAGLIAGLLLNRR